MWLVTELWWAMFLSAGAGAVLTVVSSTKRVTVERWVDAPVETPAATVEDAEVPVAAAASRTSSVAVQDDLESPFPTLAGARPWEEEELWSRPARVAAGGGRKTADTDEWSEAAESWRDWAGVATGKVAVPAEERAARGYDSPVERDSFAVPPSEAFLPGPDESPFPWDGPVDAPVRQDLPVDPFPYAQPVDPFPYAAPVEAHGGAHDDRDDDREAEEIRLALELRRREREEAERLEQERLERERLERDRADAERLEAELREAQLREAQLIEAERVERARAARLEAERLEAERLEAERLEAERLEAERLEAERLEAERLEAERLEAERLEAERLEAERAEAERLEQERVARLEAQRLEAERLEAERAEAERLERERQERERAEAKRLRRERAEAERLDQERVARLKAEAERLEREQELERQAAEATASQADEVEQVAQVEQVEQDEPEDNDWRRGPYGPGSAYAPYDGSAPVGYSVKGHMATKTFHTRRSRLYARAQADVWFDTEESAEAAGFVRWDRRGTSLGTVVAPGDQ